MPRIATLLVSIVILTLAGSGIVLTQPNESLRSQRIGPTGPVAYYSFDGQVDDQSGNSNHGSAVGGIVYSAGVRALAASFDGDNDYVELPRSIEEDFSIAFWIRTLASAPTGTNWFEGYGLVDAEVCGSPAGGDWGIALINGGQVIWGSTAHLESTDAVNDGTWHLVVVTRTLATGLVTLHIDSVAQGSSIASPFTPLTGEPWIGVGNNPCDVSFDRLYFPGTIDELKLWDRVLSPAEIQELGNLRIFADGFESGDTSAWSTASP